VNRARRLRVGAASLCLLALASTGLPALADKDAIEAILAEEEIPQQYLLDVGIQVLDPGLPEGDENALADKGVLPAVRRAEARFIPFHLKGTLESTGQWGAVRVVPAGTESTGVTVAGKIVRSTGRELVLELRVFDASGRIWRERRYKEIADELAYVDDRVEVRDPYQNLYNRIANEMLAARNKLSPEEILELREIAALKFASDLAPAAFGDYLSMNKKGRYKIERLPAEDDSMLARTAEIRERDYMFVDALNEHYAEFYWRMSEPYYDLRDISYDERMAVRQIKREAWTKKIIGGLLIVGSAMADGGSTAARVASDAAALAGVVLITEGFNQGGEAKIHVEALRELASSFDAEIKPVLVEVEGQTLRLEGSAEAQYAEWRRLLAEIWATETGLPLDPEEQARLDATEAAGH
jgi:hypothetical protein